MSAMQMEKELNAEDILRFIESDHWNANYTVGVSEFCPYQEGRRIDAFYLNRWNRETKGYEIKVTRSDFLGDKKWQQYLKFCTWFSFVAPFGIIKKEELSEKVKQPTVAWQHRVSWRSPRDRRNPAGATKAVLFSDRGPGASVVSRAVRESPHNRARRHLGHEGQGHLYLLQGPWIPRDQGRGCHRALAAAGVVNKQQSCASFEK
jgi:hypothetical protein